MFYNIFFKRANGLGTRGKRGFEGMENSGKIRFVKRWKMQTADYQPSGGR